MNLVDSLVAQGWLKTPKIIEAFRNIKREDFLPQDLKKSAELNSALPIGKEQTISQPLVVAFMMELLDPEPGDKILDIGAGSGYTSTLLGYCVRGSKDKSSSNNGKVIAIEVIPELKEFGEKNVSKYNYIKKRIIKFICADGTKGCQEEAPFDKILVSAAANQVPAALKQQLKTGGRIVIPIGSSIDLIVKESDDKFSSDSHEGFAFVPLVEK